MLKTIGKIILETEKEAVANFARKNINFLGVDLMEKKTYLVTGGTGFIGTNFIIYMLTNYKDINIINLDALTYAANLENLKEVEKDSRYKFVKANLCNIKEIEDVFKENEIDYVVNLGSGSSVVKSIKDPSNFIMSNIKSVVNLLTV